MMELYDYFLFAQALCWSGLKQSTMAEMISGARSFAAGNQA